MAAPDKHHREPDPVRPLPPTPGNGMPKDHPDNPDKPLLPKNQ